MMKTSLILFVQPVLLYLMVSCGEESTPPKPAAPAQETVKKEAGIDLENLPARPMVLMKTTLGDMKIELYHDKAPITVKNFLTYVNGGFYEGVIFQRVRENFMMQGGGYTEDFYTNWNRGRKTPRAPIKNEADNGLKNLKYTLSMARTPEKDSATSQFFINFKDNKTLDHSERDFGYAVFGKVIEGMDVVEKIEAVEKKPLPPQNREIALPVTPIKIIKIEYLNN